MIERKSSLALETESLMSKKMKITAVKPSRPWRRTRTRKWRLTTNDRRAEIICCSNGNSFLTTVPSFYIKTIASTEWNCHLVNEDKAVEEEFLFEKETESSLSAAWIKDEDR